MDRDLILEPAREIPVSHAVDVVVAGGGPAGLIGAIASARRGAGTLLIEKNGFPGGMATSGLVGPIASVRSRDGKFRLVGGIPWEMILRMEAAGGAYLRTPCKMPDVPAIEPDIRYGSDFNKGGIPFDPEIYKWVADRMLREAGVDILYHTSVAASVSTGRNLEAVVVESKSGRQAVAAKVFIDATGDADLAAFSGVEYESGRPGDNSLQPMSLVFRLSGVDTTSLGDISKITILEDIRERAAELAEKGLLPVFGGPWISWGSTFRHGEVMVNMTRVWGDATDSQAISLGESAARDHMFSFTQFLREEFAAFRNCVIMDSGCHIGVRETRRIIGRYRLEEKDLRASRQFHDSVAIGGHIIDIHSTMPSIDQIRQSLPAYLIPYRCMLPRGIDNLLVAGRPISASHESHASLRVQGTCMCIGQAAGTAAALAVENRSGAADIDPAELQRELRKDGALIDKGVEENL
jgi:FAD dependent oxidoreductase